MSASQGWKRIDYQIEREWKLNSKRGAEWKNENMPHKMPCIWNASNLFVFILIFPANKVHSPIAKDHGKLFGAR
jgi:hypothetical protein